MSAQRYPNDFNGIIAGAPAAIQAPLNGEYETWNARANQDDRGRLLYPIQARYNGKGRNAIDSQLLTIKQYCRHIIFRPFIPKGFF
jgi:hypothetical protein